MLPMLMAPHDPGTNATALDRLIHSWAGRFTKGISPAALTLACVDWMIHLQTYPGKQLLLQEKALHKAVRLMAYANRCATNPDEAPCIEPLPGDSRFAGEAWQRWPYNLIYQSFLLNQQWWHAATSDVRGLNPHHEAVVNFMSRQMLDIISPANFLLTNPEVLQRTQEESGANLVRGWQNWLDDMQRQMRDLPPAGAERWRVGDNMAATPGKVIYRNRLIELIQYTPKAKQVHAEPILFVPAWIMKYYILDLAKGRSLVEYLVSQGFTVFMISWKNPDGDDRDLGMDDYRRLGVMEALDVVGEVLPERKVHAVGYCLGGTLLSIAAADMARHDDERLASMSLFAAQIDFSEPGELDLFIDESQVTYLEDTMWEKGYLDEYKMAGAFYLLRSQDLIWSRMVRDYLMGDREKMIDLMAWNADTTRLPYRMHSEYLRRLFLNNDFAEGRYDTNGMPIVFGDIRAPIFAVGTVSDHVAPWRSAYKVNRLARTHVTFLLTTGGHNAGIVTPPGHKRRTYQMHTRRVDDQYTPPDTFQQQMPSHDGSWWPAWAVWLAERSSAKVAPPAMGAPDKGLGPLMDAPGNYVME